MSTSPGMSSYQIRTEGWKALTEWLGPAGAMRFMMQYDPNPGDYSNERREIFAALTLDDLLTTIPPQARKAERSAFVASIKPAFLSTSAATPSLVFVTM